MPAGVRRTPERTWSAATGSTAGSNKCLILTAYHQVTPGCCGSLRKPHYQAWVCFPCCGRGSDKHSRAAFDRIYSKVIQDVDTGARRRRLPVLPLCSMHSLSVGLHQLRADGRLLGGRACQSVLQNLRRSLAAALPPVPPGLRPAAQQRAVHACASIDEHEPRSEAATNGQQEQGQQHAEAAGGGDSGVAGASSVPAGEPQMLCSTTTAVGQVRRCQQQILTNDMRELTWFSPCALMHAGLGVGHPVLPPAAAVRPSPLPAAALSPGPCRPAPTPVQVMAAQANFVRVKVDSLDGAAPGEAPPRSRLLCVVRALLKKIKQASAAQQPGRRPPGACAAAPLAALRALASSAPCGQAGWLTALARL